MRSICFSLSSCHHARLYYRQLILSQSTQKWNAEDPWLLDTYRGPPYHLVPPHIPPHCNLLDADQEYIAYIRLWKRLLRGLFGAMIRCIYSVPPLMVPCQELILMELKTIAAHRFSGFVSNSFKISACLHDAIGSIVITTKFCESSGPPL